MRTIIKGKNMDVADHLREYTERKMRRLERLLDDRTDALVEFSCEQHRSASDSQIVEVTLVVNGQILRSHAAGPTHEACLDAVVDRLERQAVDAREKPREMSRGKQRRADVVAEEGTEGEAEPAAPRSQIVKTKRFDIEPMFEEDALARMEELGHHFIIFVNAENEKLSVLYKRHDGDFGLIEPVLGGEYMPGRNARRAG